jgi:hypothetical protein
VKENELTRARDARAADPISWTKRRQHAPGERCWADQLLGVVTAGSGSQRSYGAVSGRVSAAACEPQMLHVPQPSPPVHALARAWWKAFESAQSALSAASPYLSGIELGQRLRRLGKERSEIAQLLESLARDTQADSGFVRWPADSRKLRPKPPSPSAAFSSAGSKRSAAPPALRPRVPPRVAAVRR